MIFLGLKIILIRGSNYEENYLHALAVLMCLSALTMVSCGNNPEPENEPFIWDLYSNDFHLV